MKRWLWLPGILLLVGLLWAGREYVERVNRTHPAPWPMAGGGAGARNYTPARLPLVPTVLWSLPLTAVDHVAPLVGADGTIYVDAATDLLAVSPDGKKRWSWRSPGPIWSMALSRQGLLYAMDAETLYALDGDGRLRWRAELPARPSSPMLVGQGGIIYYTSGTDLHALTDDGSPRWSLTVGSVVAGPVESPGGLLLVATATDLVAIRPGGAQAWSRPLGPVLLPRALSAGPDGRIYLLTRGALYAVSEEGAVVGERPSSPTYAWNLAVGDQVVQEGLLRRNGQLEESWSLPPNRTYRTLTSLVDGGGNVLLMDSGGLVRSVGNRFSPLYNYRLFDRNGELLWSLDQLRPLSEPGVGRDGTLYFIGRPAENRPVSLMAVGERP